MVLSRDQRHAIQDLAGRFPGFRQLAGYAGREKINTILNFENAMEWIQTMGAAGIEETPYDEPIRNRRARFGPVSPLPHRGDQRHRDRMGRFIRNPAPEPISPPSVRSASGNTTITDSSPGGMSFRSGETTITDSSPSATPISRRSSRSGDTTDTYNSPPGGRTPITPMSERTEIFSPPSGRSSRSGGTTDTYNSLGIRSPITPMSGRSEIFSPPSGRSNNTNIPNGRITKLHWAPEEKYDYDFNYSSPTYKGQTPDIYRGRDESRLGKRKQFTTTPDPAQQPPDPAQPQTNVTSVDTPPSTPVRDEVSAVANLSQPQTPLGAGGATPLEAGGATPNAPRQIKPFVPRYGINNGTSSDDSKNGTSSDDSKNGTSSDDSNTGYPWDEDDVDDYEEHPSGEKEEDNEDPTDTSTIPGDDIPDASTIPGGNIPGEEGGFLPQVNIPYVRGQLPTAVDTYAANRGFIQQMYGNSGVGALTEQFFNTYSNYNNFPFTFSEQVGAREAKRLRRTMYGMPMLDPVSYMTGGLAVLQNGYKPPVSEAFNTHNQVALLQKDAQNFMRYAMVQI